MLPRLEWCSEVFAFREVKHPRPAALPRRFQARQTAETLSQMREPKRFGSPGLPS